MQQSVDLIRDIPTNKSDREFDIEKRWKKVVAISITDQ